MSSVEQLAKVVLHNWPLKIASFLIAVMLWAAVLGSRYVEDILEVPVEIITAPEMIVANEVPARIAFKISGPQAFLKTIKGRADPD
jgi:YbbR domain-containing protein